MVKTDEQAWEQYPILRPWFNKLVFAEAQGYYCGPCGTTPSHPMRCVVRPIYNLSGMGIGAVEHTIGPNDYKLIPPGYFWCEYFEGAHFSLDFELANNKYVLKHAYVANKQSVQRFVSWHRVDNAIIENNDNLTWEWLDHEFAAHGVANINVEYIKSYDFFLLEQWNPIEIHFRATEDPIYDDLIPVFAQHPVDNDYAKQGYTWVDSYEDADGHLYPPRLGFWVR